MGYRDFTQEEIRWINKFKRVMKGAPKNLFMFVGSGSVSIYSERVMADRGGVNQDVPSEEILTPMVCDGGDF